MTQQEIICILCPLGCQMNVQFTGDRIKAIEGNQCKKGIKYAKQEIIFPGRVLTTTIEMLDPNSPLLPVRSNKELPKDRLDECMREIAKHQVEQPVQIGEAVIKDILGIGIDIIACRSTQ